MGGVNRGVLWATTGEIIIIIMIKREKISKTSVVI